MFHTYNIGYSYKELEVKTETYFDEAKYDVKYCQGQLDYYREAVYQDELAKQQQEAIIAKRKQEVLIAKQKQEELIAKQKQEELIAKQKRDLCDDLLFENVKDFNTNMSAGKHDLSVLGNLYNNSHVSYKNAKAITSLENNDAEHEHLPIETQNVSKEIAESQADIVTPTSLNHIGITGVDIKSSSYLNLNIVNLSTLLYLLKSGGMNGHTSEETDDLVNYIHNKVLDKNYLNLQSDNDITQIISKSCNNILELFKENSLYNFNQLQSDNLTGLIGSILDTLPDLLKPALELIKLVTTLHQNKELMGKLIGKLNYYLCFFGKCACESTLSIVEALESHLLDDEEIYINNTCSLRDSITIIKHLSYGGNILSESLYLN
eukprot:GHVR01017612.1.p1 GENE.GHVR01017612.1~~GHVR01017612.1.p1  ORF type:complete len:377 (-),score=47.71 GHVR01017612.1:1119-2249(-)